MHKFTTRAKILKLRQIIKYIKVYWPISSVHTHNSQGFEVRFLGAIFMPSA